MTGRARAREAFERGYALALTARDPARAFAALGRDRRFSPDLRRRLAAADPDGVRLAALLVAQLRFERLLRGSSDALGWFDRDPAGFTRAFRRYHRGVPPTAFFPSEEAELFAAWSARSTRSNAPRPRRKRGRLPRSTRGPAPG